MFTKQETLFIALLVSAAITGGIVRGLKERSSSFAGGFMIRQSLREVVEASGKNAEETQPGGDSTVANSPRRNQDSAAGVRRPSGENRSGQRSAVKKRGQFGKININTATQAELESLPGIGPSLAGRIIRYRSENGPFESVGELVNVKGIGRKTLEKLLPELERIGR